MLHPKHKPIFRLFIYRQATSLLYFVLLFLIYFVLFEFASLSLLIGALKYLSPLLVAGVVLIILNLWRAWVIYQRR